MVDFNPKEVVDFDPAVDFESNGISLDATNEADFQQWYSKWAQKTGLNPDPDNPQHKYDYRAAYNAGVEPVILPEDNKYHWDSRFKADDHSNRFVDGIDTTTGLSATIDFEEDVDAATGAERRAVPGGLLDLSAPPEIVFGGVEDQRSFIKAGIIDPLKIGVLRLGRALVDLPTHMQPIPPLGQTNQFFATKDDPVPTAASLRKRLQKESENWIVGDNIQRIIDNHPEWRGEPPENFIDLVSSPRKLSAAIFESAPTMVAAGLTTAAGQPIAAVTIMYAVEGQEAYDQAIRDGATPEQAQDTYKLYGSVAAGIEFLQLRQGLKILKGTKDLIIKRTVQKVAQRGGKTFSRQLMETAAKEAVEEVAQGRWQEITAKVVYDKPLPAPAEMIDRALQEATVAAVATLGTGLPGVSIQTAQTFQQQFEQARIDTAAEAMTPERHAEIRSGQGAIPSARELEVFLQSEEPGKFGPAVTQEQTRMFTLEEGPDVGTPLRLPKIAVPPRRDDITSQVPELAERSVSVGDKLDDQGNLIKGFEGTLTGEFTINAEDEQVATVVDSLGKRQSILVQDILIPKDAGEATIEQAKTVGIPTTKEAKTVQKALNALKRTVHKTQREMKMGDAQYSKIAFETTGKRSAANMTSEELTDFNNALKATDPSVNFVNQNRITESQDTGSRLVSTDENIKKEQERDRIIQIRNVRRTNAAVRVAEAKGKEKSIIDHFAPKRLAVAKFEDKTSVPVTYLDHQTTRKAKIRGHTAKEEFGKLLAGMEHDTQLSPKNTKAVIKGIERLIQTTSRESNEQIANWLFSEETRAEVEHFMSDKDLATAATLERILQDSVVASERMQESLRLWIDRGKAPSDIKKFDKEQQKNIFEQAKEAQKNGALGEFTQQLFDNNVRFGLRRYYYPSETEHTDTVLDMLKNATVDPIETFASAEAEAPSLIGGETRARKGKGKPRKGSVFANIMSSYERVAVRNAVAEDVKELYNRYNTIPLSSSDKKYLEGVYGEMLLKGELTTPPHNIIQKLHATFWRTHLSLVTNPFGAMKATIRNSLQFLEAGGAVNVRAMTATGFDIANQLATGKTLADIDPQMSEDFHRSFEPYVSQRGSQYKDAMFRDIDAKAKADNLPDRAVDMAKLILDKTGFAYVGVDTVSRASLWPTVYKTTKDAANRYIKGEITYAKYLDVTNVDTMMSPSQTRAARELLSAGDVRGLANYVADIYTFDVFRAYASVERAGIERTRQERELTGIYTYPRGVFDLFYSRGLRPLLSKDSSVSQRRRAAANVTKSYLGRRVANTTLVGLGLGSMYALSRTLYTPIAPGLAIPAEALSRVSLVGFRYAEGEIDEDEAIRAISKILYQAADDILHALPDIKKKATGGLPQLEKLEPLKPLE